MAFVFDSLVCFRGEVAQNPAKVAPSNAHNAAVKVASAVDRFPPPSPSVVQTNVSRVPTDEELSSLDLLADCALAPQSQRMEIGQKRNRNNDYCFKNCCSYCFSCCFTCCTNREERQGFQEVEKAVQDINLIAAQVRDVFSRGS